VAAHEAVSRRTPISIVARTEGYAYDAKVWDLSNVQGPFSCRLVPNPFVTIRNVLHRCTPLSAFAWGRGVAQQTGREPKTTNLVLGDQDSNWCVKKKPQSRRNAVYGGFCALAGTRTPTTSS
jgi:hypothetical protein